MCLDNYKEFKNGTSHSCIINQPILESKYKTHKTKENTWGDIQREG